MAEKKKVGDVIDGMMTGGKGGSDTSADAAVANIKKIVAGLTSSTTEMAKQVSALESTVKKGNLAALAKELDDASSKTSKDIQNSLTLLSKNFSTLTTTYSNSIKTSLNSSSDRFKKDMTDSLGKTSKDIGGSIRDSLDKLSTDIEKQTKLSIKNVRDSASGGGAGGAVPGIAGLIMQAITAIIDTIDRVAAAAINIQTSALARATQAMGGVAAATSAFGGMVQDVLKQMAELPVGKMFGNTLNAMGDLFGQIASTAGALFMYDFERSLSRATIRYRAEAQSTGTTGAARGKEAVGTMETMWGSGRYSRAEAEAWGAAVLDQGAAFTSGLKNDMVSVGKSFNIEPGAMGQVLDQYMQFAPTGEKAGNLMALSFSAARKSAESLGISTTKVEKYIRDAAVQARFLNVDVKTVGNTFKLLEENKARLEAAGISTRGEAMGKMLGEFTGKKFSDAMHVYFGTKGGTEGDPMEGLIKSKFGSKFGETLKATAGGGFTATGGSGGDMVAQKMDIMKSTMLEASKGAKTDAERLQIQMMVAEQTFGMSEDSAKALAMMDQAGMKKLAEDPKWANELKTEKEIMSSMASMDAANYRVQQQMAELARRQLDATLGIALATELEAAEKAGIDTTKLRATLGDNKGITMESALMKSMEATLNMVGKTAEIFGKTAKSASPSTVGDIQKVQGALVDRGKKYMSDVEETKTLTAEGVYRGGNQQGGYVLPALAGRNVYSTVEDGRPELFHSGSGSNTLFAPGESGRIFNASETMGAFKKGLGGGGGEGGGAPTVNRSGSGEQTILNITINAGTLDKSSFAKLLETEVLNHIYR